MRVVLFAGLVGLSVAIAAGARPAALWGYYRELYPTDPVKQAALDRCFLLDRRFDRLDPAARAACYRHDPGLRATAAAGSARPAPRQNFVDRWRAAGEGRLPQNDVRAQEQNRRYLQRAAAER